MKEGISTRQAILLIVICRAGTILTIMPTIYVEPANQDIWIVIILSFFYTILVSSPLLYLSSKFNELSFIGYIEKIFGRILGKIIGAIYIFCYIRMAIVYAHMFVQMIRSSFLTDIKPLITIIFLIFTCIYIASKGSVVLGRYTELLGPVVLGFIGFFIILGYNSVDLSVLLPIYKDSTFWNINYGAIKLTYLFIDLYILLMISPKLEKKEDRNIIYLYSVFFSLLIILITVVVTQGALGIEQAKHSNFPFLLFIRLIDAYSIFERVESIYILLWIFAMIIKITAYIHIADIGIREITKKERGNSYLYIIGAISIAMTFYVAELNPRTTEMINIKPWEYIYYLIHKTIIPLVALLVYFLRRKTLESQDRLQD